MREITAFWIYLKKIIQSYRQHNIPKTLKYDASKSDFNMHSDAGIFVSQIRKSIPKFHAPLMTQKNSGSRSWHTVVWVLLGLHYVKTRKKTACVFETAIWLQYSANKRILPVINNGHLISKDINNKLAVNIQFEKIYLFDNHQHSNQADRCRCRQLCHRGFQGFRIQCYICVHSFDRRFHHCILGVKCCF